MNSNSNSENITQDDHFSFCLSWNTNGWNHDKKDSIEYFISMYKPLFLCFQETGNGTGTKNIYPCKVKISNYKYFRIKADETIPGKRGLFIGYHKSCQASLDSSSYEYIVSLRTYSLWNCSECSIGNIYVPQRRHTIFVQHAKLELISWLQSHSSNPSILIGDFNLTTEKLENLISSFSDWKVLPLIGSTTSWSKGKRSSDIDHAIVNDKMLKLLSSGSFIDFPPISDHKPLLIYGKSFSPETSFSSPKKTVRWDRQKCLSKKALIVNNNYFHLLESEFRDTDASIDDLTKSFISTALTIADELNITSTKEVQKSFFHMSQSIFLLQKKKVKLYKKIKKNSSSGIINEFVNLIAKYRKLCMKIQKNVMNIGKNCINVGLLLVVNILKHIIQKKLGNG